MGKEKRREKKLQSYFLKYIYTTSVIDNIGGKEQERLKDSKFLAWDTASAKATSHSFQF